MMSSRRDQAIELMKQQKYEDALVLFQQLIPHKPMDWALLYMAGQCCCFLNDLTGAIEYLRKSVKINSHEPPVLLALGIALQLNEELEDAVDAFKRAIDANPDYELAYNGLALTQKKMGQLDNALHNYDAGIKALVRKIVKNMRNARSSKILKHGNSRHDLWAEYASFGAMYLCCNCEGIDSISWPTGAQAAEEERTERHAGLYWIDRKTTDGKVTRLFLPNFFNTFREMLRVDPAYSFLIGGRGTVFDLLGKSDEAKKHLEESEDFTPKA